MDRVAVSDAPVGRPNERRRFTFVAAGRSDVGRFRDHNEDFVFVGRNLIAVADGVGGNVFGEVASEMVTQAIGYLEDRVYVGAPVDEAREAALYANSRLAAAAGANAELHGMATTLTALRLDGPSVVVLHVGDSRAYRCRGAQVERITRDDSFVQALVDQGAISTEQAKVHPSRSVVLQALNGGPVVPHVASVDVAAGDRYLVCSDGLSDYVDAPVIAETLRSVADPEHASRELIDAALRMGSRDNVSVVVADVAALVDIDGTSSGPPTL